MRCFLKKKFSCGILFWQPHPLQFESRGATFSDGWQEVSSVLISAYNQLSPVSVPYNFNTAQVSDTRTGLEQGQLLGLFQISTARMVAGRKGPDCWDNLISWCWSRKDGRVTQPDRGQPVAGKRREITKSLFVSFILKKKHSLTKVKKQDDKYHVENSLFVFFRSGFHSCRAEWTVGE